MTPETPLSILLCRIALLICFLGIGGGVALYMGSLGRQGHIACEQRHSLDGLLIYYQSLTKGWLEPL